MLERWPPVLAAGHQPVLIDRVLAELANHRAPDLLGEMGRQSLLRPPLANAEIGLAGRGRHDGLDHPLLDHPVENSVAQLQGAVTIPEW